MKLFSLIFIFLNFVKIFTAKQKRITNGLHEFDIFLDTETLNQDKNISSRFRYRIKKILNNTVDILSTMLLSNNSKKITYKSNISKACEQNIPYYDETIHKGINTDLVLYVLFDKKQRPFITQGICVTFTKNSRPSFGYIKFSKHLNFSKYNNDQITTIVLHHLTHLLGFTKKKMKKFTNKPELNTTIDFDEDDEEITFDGSILLNELFLKRKRSYINVKTKKNDFHWDDDIPFPDYMKQNEKNYLISPYTLSLLDKFKFYVVQLPYLRYDTKTNSYDIRSYLIFENTLIEVGQCYGDNFILFIKNGNKCLNSNRKHETEVTLLKYPELNNITNQTLLVISPSEKCINPQKTVYFKYLPIVNITQKPKNPISTMILSLKEYMIVSLENFGSGNSSPGCLRRNMLNTNLTKIKFLKESNSLWYNSGTMKPPFISQYSKYNHFLKHSQITRKDYLYLNYYNMSQKFPEDFTYMSETYNLPKDLNIIKEKFIDYQPTEDNLWLIKPKGSARGEGIEFLKNYSHIPNSAILTKYISNPHLLEGKKYDCRIYLLVTSHRPLKIYIYSEGLARRATETFNLDINNLDNFFIHLTNVAVNKKNRKFIEGDENSDQRSIWSLTMLRNQLEKEGRNFDEIFKKIQDIGIKAIISMTHTELEEEDKKKNYNINSQNLFELYGMDILIDQNMKPWLLEINLSPSLASIGKYEERLKLQLFADMYNIIGLKPYSHYDYEPYEYGPEYKNKIDESINESICEFGRPLGGFIRVFPRRDNYKYYKQFFSDPGDENLELWKQIEKIDI